MATMNVGFLALISALAALGASMDLVHTFTPPDGVLRLAFHDDDAIDLYLWAADGVDSWHMRCAEPLLGGGSARLVVDMSDDVNAVAAHARGHAVRCRATRREVHFLSPVKNAAQGAAEFLRDMRETGARMRAALVNLDAKRSKAH